jgi:hypothetical protein
MIMPLPPSTLPRPSSPCPYPRPRHSTLSPGTCFVTSGWHRQRKCSPPEVAAVAGAAAAGCSWFCVVKQGDRIAFLANASAFKNKRKEPGGEGLSMLRFAAGRATRERVDTTFGESCAPVLCTSSCGGREMNLAAALALLLGDACIITRSSSHFSTELHPCREVDIHAIGTLSYGVWFH